jgi:glycogen debranching enzyme
MAHDNSIISTGFRRYGFAEEVCRIFAGISISLLHSTSNMGSVSDTQGKAIRDII